MQMKESSRCILRRTGRRAGSELRQPHEGRLVRLQAELGAVAHGLLAPALEVSHAELHPFQVRPSL